MSRFGQVIIYLIAAQFVLAQNYSYQSSVQLYTTLIEKDTTIIVRWALDTDANKYTIYRKLKTASTWGTALAVYPKDSFRYIDHNVELGKNYEYLVTRSNLSSGTVGSGFLLSGIKYNPGYTKGSILLLVDQRIENSIKSELATFNDDLINEGWNTLQYSVPDSLKVPVIKSKIKSFKNQYPDLRTVVIIGHVKVPYSGNSAYDGHPDHNGAWPSDSYYADLDGPWTDTQVNITTPARTENHNIPGDGKFDASRIPTDLELEVGRIDFFNLPIFPKSEVQLLKSYFSKNHKFRVSEFKANRRGIVQDNFNYAEGFGQSGIKNFSSFFGPNSVFGGSYRTDLLAESYLWSYGAGGGWYEGAGGISDSKNMTTDSLQTVFTFLFGSYFGDWDSPNNFLRSSLGSGTILTAAWAGRPVWAVHQMGLGETIGFCARISQNNQSTYTPAGSGAKGTHSALLGDPSLILFPVKSASNLNLTNVPTGVQLTWTASPEQTDGYTILRKLKSEIHFSVIKEFHKELSYIDVCATIDSTYDYMVRAIKLETSASGSYYNASPGIRASIKPLSNLNTKAIYTSHSDFEFYNTTSNSINALNYSWTVDGKVLNTSSMFDFVLDCKNKSAKICLIAQGLCNTDTSCQIVNYNCSTPELSKYRVEPTIKCFGDKTSIYLDSISGASPFTFEWSNGAKTKDLSQVPTGEYSVTMISRLQTKNQTKIILTEPAELIVDIAVVNATPFKPGSAKITVQGGTIPYTNTYPNGFNPDSLAVGEYKITITDANGCAVIKTIKIELNTNQQNYESDAIILYPSLAKDHIYLDWENDQNFDRIVLLNYEGKLVNSNMNIVKKQRISIENLSSGKYVIQLKRGDRIIQKFFEKI
ncbi:MAG: hypothetical protein IPL98_18700 [Saprospiraceae bacterium]|nr:hypothetical protein [Saprospiraceae bacterium]